jgi:hypothetical protein
MSYYPLTWSGWSMFSAVLGQAGVGHCMLRIHHICMYCASRYNTVSAKLIVLFSFTIGCCTVSLMESMTGWLPRANSLESFTHISLTVQLFSTRFQQMAEGWFWISERIENSVISIYLQLQSVFLPPFGSCHPSEGGYSNSSSDGYILGSRDGSVGVVTGLRAEWPNTAGDIQYYTH